MSTKTQLKAIIDDPAMAELHVDGTGAVYVRNTTNNGRLKKISMRFQTKKELWEAIENALNSLNLEMPKENPVLTARTTEGVQIYATKPPVTMAGPTLTVIKGRAWDECEFAQAPPWGIACREGLEMYEFGVEYDVKPFSQNVAFMKGRPDIDYDPETHGGVICQGIRGFGYRNARIRLSAQARTVDSFRSGLFLRVDNQERAAAAIGNMWNEPLRGTLDWQHCEVEVDVPADAIYILLGLWHHHQGTLLVRDLKFEVTQEPPLLRRKRPPRQKPVNLEFAPAIFKDG